VGKIERLLSHVISHWLNKEKGFPEGDRRDYSSPTRSFQDDKEGGRMKKEEQGKEDGRIRQSDREKV
jgi:hypothetical protein